MTTRIKDRRLVSGETQSQLADAVGVRRETIVFLEQGKYNPSLRLAHAIARHFALPIEELFDFSDEDGSPGN